MLKKKVFSRFCVLWKNLVESCFDTSKRQRIQFATEITDRELLGRPVARYSAVFVFHHVLTRVSAGGWQFPRICACVGMGDMWGQAALLGTGHM